MLSRTLKQLTPAISTALRCNVMASTTSVVRFYTSGATTGNSKPSEDEHAFNKEFSQKDYDEHVKEEIEYERSSDGGKTHIKYNIEGFKDLQDKGDKTAQEQERPEDYM